MKVNFKDRKSQMIVGVVVLGLGVLAYFYNKRLKTSNAYSQNDGEEISLNPLNNLIKNNSQAGVFADSPTKEASLMDAQKKQLEIIYSNCKTEECKINTLNKIKSLELSMSAIIDKLVTKI
jgi:hypothetical protein